MNPSEKTRLTVAITPANSAGPSSNRERSPTSTRPIPCVSRQDSLNTIAAAINAPARATTSHKSGCALPNGAKIVVKMTGSGFHVGPPVVCSLKWTISRPQTSQAHGS